MDDDQLFALYKQHPDATPGDLPNILGLSVRELRYHQIAARWALIKALDEQWQLFGGSKRTPINWVQLAKEKGVAAAMRKLGVVKDKCLRGLLSEYLRRVNLNHELLDADIYLHYFRVLGSYRAVARKFKLHDMTVKQYILRAYNEPTVHPKRHEAVINLVKDYLVLMDDRGVYDQVWEWLNGLTPTQLPQANLLRTTLKDDNPKWLGKRDRQAMHRQANRAS